MCQHNVRPAVSTKVKLVENESLLITKHDEFVAVGSLLLALICQNKIVPCNVQIVRIKQ